MSRKRARSGAADHKSWGSVMHISTILSTSCFRSGRDSLFLVVLPQNSTKLDRTDKKEGSRLPFAHFVQNRAEFSVGNLRISEKIAYTNQKFFVILVVVKICLKFASMGCEAGCCIDALMACKLYVAGKMGAIFCVLQAGTVPFRLSTTMINVKKERKLQP